MYINKMLINYLEDPQGIVRMPQLSWVIASDGKNIVQEAYQVQVAKDLSFMDVSWDSGWVKSQESARIQLKGFELETGRRYYVRVRIKVIGGAISPWSDQNNFLTGLISPDQWKCACITGESIQDADISKGTYLRRTFTLDKEVKEAYAFTSALGLYHLYVNGQRASDMELAPGWTSYKRRMQYQTTDISHLLKKGENTLGAHVGAGWYKGLMGLVKSRNNYGAITGFIGQILIRYQDGSQEILVTDKEWLSIDSPVVFSEIYDGEIYDAGKEIDNWSENNCDVKDWKPVDLLDYDKNILEPQHGSLVRVIQETKPKEILRTPKGETVIDFGQNMSGWVKFKVLGKKGDRVHIRCFEVLDQEGNAYFDNLRRAKQELIYTCKGVQMETYQPNFTFQGFRYALVESYPGAIESENFVACTVHSDMAATGTFECSNPYINQLQSNIVWGLKSNFVDVPTDCPQRDERLGWTGDAQIFSRTASYLYNTHTFFTKWLRDLSVDQTEEGGVPHVVPDILDGHVQGNWLLEEGTHSAAGWADAAIIIPWVLYQSMGDKQILIDQYESMKKWVSFMENHSNDYVWNYKVQFGDWVALDAEEGSYFGATPNDLTCTGYFAYSTGLFSKIADILGQDEDKKRYEQVHHKVKTRFQELFFDADGSMNVRTQTAHVIALYFGLTPDAYIDKTAKNLVELIKKENGHLVTGFVGTPYICHALSQNGHIKEAYDLLLKDDFPSWLYQVKMGATTIWEHWDGIKPDGTMWNPGMNSFNHYAYGAIGEWLYRVAGGLEIDDLESGYKHSIIKPMIGGNLDYVKASLDTVYGQLESQWRVQGKTVELTLIIPHNTHTSIYLDQAGEIVSSGGLDYIKTDKGYEAHTGSGTYKTVFILKES